MSSGIDVDKEVITKIAAMKMKSTHKWQTFKMSDDLKQIIFDEAAEPKETLQREDDEIEFAALKAKLTDEPRYIIYDFQFKRKDERMLKKLAFINWCSDCTTVKKRMLYASSKGAFKKSALGGHMLEFQANDMDMLDYDTIANEVEKKS